MKLAILLAIPLAGCAVAAKIDARQEYQASASAYKSCLLSSPAANCENLRLAMETDERKYTNISAGANPGAQRAANITVLQR